MPERVVGQCERCVTEFAARRGARFCSRNCYNLRDRQPLAHGTESGYCRGCRCAACRQAVSSAERARRRRRAALDPEGVRVKKRAEYERNKDRYRARSRAYRAANLGAILAQQDGYRDSNRDALRAAARERHWRNRDYCNAQSRTQSDRRQRAVSGSRNGEPRTAEEDAIALRSGLTIVERAAMLRRSVGSVNGRRGRLAAP